MSKHSRATRQSLSSSLGFYIISLFIRLGLQAFHHHHQYKYNTMSTSRMSSRSEFSTDDSDEEFFDTVEYTDDKTGGPSPAGPTAATTDAAERPPAVPPRPSIAVSQSVPVGMKGMEGHSSDSKSDNSESSISHGSDDVIEEESSPVDGSIEKPTPPPRPVLPGKSPSASPPPRPVLDSDTRHLLVSSTTVSRDKVGSGPEPPPRPSSSGLDKPVAVSTAKSAPNVPRRKGGESRRPQYAQKKPPEEFPMQKNLVKNLDTGEVCEINEVETVFTEVRKAHNLGALLDEPSNERIERVGEQKSGDSDSVEETHTKKQALGFMERLKKAVRGHQTMRLSDTPDNSVKTKTKGKSMQELTQLRCVQDVLHHTGPIWVAKFSPDGQFLATGGQDSIVRVWAVVGTPAAEELLQRMEKKEEASASASGANFGGGSGGVHAASGGASTGTSTNSQSLNAPYNPSGKDVLMPFVKEIPADMGGRAVIMPTPYRMYSGHKNDVIDLAWNKANFLLSASIDKTVRLWHVTRQKQLRLFQHSDFVTAVNFHPTEDKYFVSGSFDKKLRVWNIPEHCVIGWAQTMSIITAADFAPNGKTVVAGLYNGTCVFYHTDNVKYLTLIECRNRHGKDKKGRKVTGLQFSPDGKQLLVTTNDSRIRLFDMDDYSCTMKFKGLSNDELQIRASFSDDGKHIICGSNDAFVYIWSTGNSFQPRGAAATASREKVSAYEKFKAHQNATTTAQFAPINVVRTSAKTPLDAINIRHLLVTTGYNGELKVFENRGVPRSV